MRPFPRRRQFPESSAAGDEITDPDLQLQVKSSLYYDLGAAHLFAYDLGGFSRRL
jgi:hypothetical protein